MKDLMVLAFFLMMGTFALYQRATKDPFDYRKELHTDSTKPDSLAYAFEKSLEKKKEKR